jgi:hypothetical protein
VGLGAGIGNDVGAGAGCCGE